MSHKGIYIGNIARTKLKRGVNKLGDAVRVTLGAKGRNVVIETSLGEPQPTKDGVTVAQNVILKDAVERMGAEMLKKAANKVVKKAGDGTTSTTCIAQRMVNLLDDALKNNDNLNPVDLKEEIEKLTIKYNQWLESKSTKIDINSNDLNKVAIVSANNDVELGNLIANTFKQVGKDGVILVDESQSHLTYSNLIEGVQYNRGYVSSQFITEESNKTTVLENTYILIMDKKLARLEEIKENILLPILEENASLLIICEDIEPQILNFLILNKKQGGLKICVVKTPSYGEHRFKLLEDMAIMTNGSLVSASNGITPLDLDLYDLGRADKVIVSEESFTLIGAKGLSNPDNYNEIQKRIVSIKADIESSISEFERDQMQERLAKLAAKVANLYVGGYTEMEIKEKKDRVDDAIRAVQCALAGGIMPGGGMAYLGFILESNGEAGKPSIMHFGNPVRNSLYHTARYIMSHSLYEPFKRILLNAGEDPDKRMDFLDLSGNNIFNVKTGKVEDAFEAGIIDPTIVAAEVVNNAVSVAMSILMTECVIVDETNVFDEYKDKNREWEQNPYNKKA